MHGMNQGDLQRLHAARSRPKNATTLLAAPKSVSALPGDVSDDKTHICVRFRRRSLLGSFGAVGAGK